MGIHPLEAVEQLAERAKEINRKRLIELNNRDLQKTELKMTKEFVKCWNHTIGVPATTIANGRAVVNNADALWRPKYCLAKMANTYSRNTAKNTEHENQECRTKNPRMVWNALGCDYGVTLRERFKSNNLTFVDELIAERLSGEIVESPTTQAMMQALWWSRWPWTPTKTRRAPMHVKWDSYSRPTRLVGHQSRCVVYENNVPIGGVEIKCPSTKKHVEYFQGRCPHNTNRKWCTTWLWLTHCNGLTLFFDPRIQKNLFIFRVNRNDPQIEMDLEMRKQSYLKFWDKLQTYERQITEWFRILASGQRIFQSDGQTARHWYD